MPLPQAAPAEYVVVSSGIDWLTATAKNGARSLELDRLAEVEFSSRRLTQEQPAAQRRLGFEGYAVEGMFFGRREHDVMMQLSGATCMSLAAPVVHCATNISRCDLQVTVFTEGEVVQLACDIYRRLKSITGVVGRPRSYGLTINHPEGQTLYINSRNSDQFARVYDKGVESRSCGAGMLWRYEIELKRDAAKQAAYQVAHSERPAASARCLVHQWMSQRGVEPGFPYASDDTSCQLIIPKQTRDVLIWMEESLSKTVGKAVSSYGLTAVLKALGLSDLVQPKEGVANGTLRRGDDAVSSDPGPDLAQSDDSERLLLSEQQPSDRPEHHQSYELVHAKVQKLCPTENHANNLPGAGLSVNGHEHTGAAQWANHGGNISDESGVSSR